MTSSRKTTPEVPSDSKEAPPADLLAAFLAPLDELADRMTSIAEEIRNPEGPYAAKVREAFSAVKKSEEETKTTVRKEFDAQFRVAMETVREQYNTRFLEAKRDLETERDTLAQQLAEVKQKDRAEVLHAELKRTTDALTTAEAEIAQMVEDPDVELSKIIRHNAMQSELKAYLRGLQYQAEMKNSGSTGAKETS